MLAKLLQSCWDSMIPLTVAHQDPLSMGFPQARILEWVAILSPPGDLPNPGVEPTSLVFPALVGGF